MLPDGSTRQQPVTSYGVKNKSTELHLTSVAPLPLSSCLHSHSFSLSPSCCILRITNEEAQTGPPQYTLARTYTHARTRVCACVCVCTYVRVNSSRWSTKRKIIERKRAKETEKERQKKRGRRSRSYLTG